MMERSDLVEALELTIDGGDRFIKALVDAQAALRTASTEITSADEDDETMEIAVDVRRRAIFIAASLETARAPASTEE